MTMGKGKTIQKYHKKKCHPELAKGVRRIYGRFFASLRMTKREESYADSLCFLKQSLQRTGLFPFGSKGTVSLLPQFAQVIGKD